MAKLTPVDYDPFAEQAGPKLVAVDYDPFAEAPKEAQKRPVGAEALRQLGLTARYGLEGLGGAVGVFSDPIALAVPGASRAGELATYTADKLGLPKPEGGLERVVGGATRAGFGALPTLGAGGVAAQSPGLTGRVGQAIYQSPFMQTVAAATGGASSETAREAGAGWGGQLVAGLAGALAPSATAATVRGLARGGEAGRQGVIASIDEFERAGAGSPTIGQAVSGWRARVGQGMEAVLGRTPGGAGVIAKASDRQQAGMGAKAEEIARGLAPGATAEKAGRAIERGVIGPNGFMADFRKKASALYGEVDRYIPPATPIPVARTKQVLDTLASPTPGAAQTSQVLASGKVADLRNALDADLQASLAAAGRGELPYEAVKQLRSRLGDLIADSTFSSDVPTKQLKQVWGALSEDMGAAVRSTGNPDAVRAATRANNFYRVGMDRIEALERVVDRNGGGERIYAAAISGTKDGATTLRGVMQSLPKDARKMFMAAFVRRLGKEKPGVQDTPDAGFSSETFLTNYNNLSNEAKSAMFGRMGPKYQRDLEAIAAAAGGRRAGAEVFKNPSRTTDGIIQAGTVLSFAHNLFTGGFETAGLIAAGVAGANGAARVMTSPVAVGWLARQTKTPLAALPVQLSQLRAEAQAAGDAEALAFAAALEKSAVGDTANNRQ